MHEIVSSINFNNAIDIGCGEGYIFYNLQHVFENKHIYGLDLNQEHILAAKENVPFCDFQVGSVYETGFDENQFDLVICNEVFEHLDIPSNALFELHRITNKYLIISFL